MSDSNIEILRKESFLIIIENSIGSKMFNSMFVRLKDSGAVTDILNDGEFSCAFYVSSVLMLLRVIEKPRATVLKLKEVIVNDSNWQTVEVDTIEPGDVIFYVKTKFKDGTSNAHVGLALSKGEVVSTDHRVKKVAKHPVDYRPIEAVFRYTAW
ncbi:hypothetical protein H6784_03160 [Candidatus Nomurabacteria bacterium]|nr:hypothetical protein [Candidatus Kaiserbacteria bacterium]MCB9814393.1 hypothetical protein [Candidatus Nomurabacteria bacterium]